MIYYGLYIYSNRIIDDDFQVLEDDGQTNGNRSTKTGCEVVFLGVRERLISLREVLVQSLAFYL